MCSLFRIEWYHFCIALLHVNKSCFDDAINATRSNNKTYRYIPMQRQSMGKLNPWENWKMSAQQQQAKIIYIITADGDASYVLLMKKLMELRVKEDSNTAADTSFGDGSYTMLLDGMWESVDVLSINLSLYFLDSVKMVPILLALTQNQFKSLPLLFCNDTFVGSYADVDLQTALADAKAFSTLLKQSFVLARTMVTGSNKRLSAALSKNHASISQLLAIPTSFVMPQEQSSNGKLYGDQFWKQDSFFELLTDGKRGIEIKDRWYHLKVYKKCFIASELVTWILVYFGDKLNNDRSKATQVAQELMNMGYIHHVLRHHDFKDEYLFFRLDRDAQDYDAFALNLSNKKMPYVSKIHMTELIQELRVLLLPIRTCHSFTEFAKLQVFSQDYLKKVPELTIVPHVDKLSEAEKKFFFIQLYTLLFVHACVDGATKDTPQQFMSKYRYKLSAHLFSLFDILHGVLRCNRAIADPSSSILCNNNSVTANTSVFQQGKDPRVKYALLNMDARIFFAIPLPLEEYQFTKWTSMLYWAPAEPMTSLNQQLEHLAQEYCHRNVEVQFSSKVITLPHVCECFVHDFAHAYVQACAVKNMEPLHPQNTVIQMLHYVKQYVAEKTKEEIDNLIAFNEKDMKIKYKSGKMFVKCHAL